MASNLIAMTFAWTSFNTKSLVSNSDGLHLVAMASNLYNSDDLCMDQFQYLPVTVQYLPVACF